MVNFRDLVREDINKKTENLEEAFRRHVIPFSGGGGVVRIAEDSSHNTFVTAHPELEEAAQEFITALRFNDFLSEPLIDTRLYKKRIAGQGIDLNYNWGEAA